MRKYEELMSAIIKKMVSLLGTDRALTPVRSIAGISVSADGTVTSGGSKESLDSVCQAYVKIASGVARILMKSAIAPLIQGSDIDLPTVLR